MKKVFYSKGFIIFLLSLSFISCEKSADDPAKLLVGTWNQESTTIVYYYDYVQQSETHKNYNSGELVMEIYSDGKAKKFLNGVIFDSFFWNLEGNLFVTTNNNGVIYKAEFILNGSKLTLKWAVENTDDGHLSRSEYVSIYDKAK